MTGVRHRRLVDGKAGIRVMERVDEGLEEDVTRFFVLYPEPLPGEKLKEYQSRWLDLTAETRGLRKRGML